jgi:hypothetical protein
MHIWLIFSMPTPCSPVIVPPTLMQSSRMSEAYCLGLLELARVVRVVEDERVQVAVARVEDVRAAQPVLHRELADAREDLPQSAPRGIEPSMQ